MFDDSAHTLSWAARVLSDHLRPAIHTDRRPLAVAAWTTPDSVRRPPTRADALAAEHTPIEPGQPWGAPWSTWWFEITGEIPAEFAGRRVEVLIDLGFTSVTPGFQAEGLLHDWDGLPLKGIHPRNRWYRVADPARAGTPIRLRLEAAANPTIFDGSFAPTSLGDPATAGDLPLHRLGAVEVAVFQPEVFGLAMDLDVLLDLAAQLGTETTRSRQIAAAVADALTRLDVQDVPGTAAGVRDGLAEVLAAPANASAQQLTAVGHAHIDSAWLWPVRETRRKCARTFANVTALAQEYPELVFACSSAQQYRWMQQDHPEIWQRIRDAVAAGTWEPVGGMWVEADGVMPSGESLVRQLVHGQRFFRREFGRPCTGVWLPDSFGYSGSYPQIARLAGARWFLTQKISWNDTNTFPHHTFWWEGIDGTRILTHFPPADTYNSDLTGADLHRSANSYRERGRSQQALIPFGFGDGGGGPEREMLERARRLSSLEGAPQVRIGAADDFFAGLHQEYAEHAPTWHGELYLELHRGTLTSQRAMKEGNRRTESLLRQVELVWTMVSLRGAGDWPGEQVSSSWERLLLLQFHDILPGSAIAWVHAEARAEFDALQSELGALLRQGLALLGGGVLNAGPLDRREVIETPTGPRLVEVPALSIGSGVALVPRHPVQADERRLENGLVRVRIADDGSIESLRDLRHDRELVPAGEQAAQLRLHPDLPLLWDAWDLDKRHRSSWRLPEPARLTLTENTPLRAVVEARTRIGSSTVVQRTILSADSARVDVQLEVDWRDRSATLAAYVPVSVLASQSRAEIQFGHLSRPTHENTSWEAARFEAVAHRWLHVGDTGWGVALVNDSHYGHSAVAGVAEDGEPMTIMRLTLLRAPSYPDPHTDEGPHSIRFGIVPGADVAEAIAHGYAVNLPLTGGPALGAGGSADQPTMPAAGAPGDPSGAPAVADLFDRSGAAGAAEPPGRAGVPAVVTVDEPGCVVECVKLADDGSGEVIVRLYEALGGRRRVRLRPGFDWRAVVETDLLEDELAPQARRSIIEPTGSDAIDLLLRPFHLVTLRLTPGAVRSAADLS